MKGSALITVVQFYPFFESRSSAMQSYSSFKAYIINLQLKKFIYLSSRYPLRTLQREASYLNKGDIR